MSYVAQLQTFANGQTDYVSRLNGNFGVLGSGLDAAVSLIQGQVGPQATIANSTRGIYGTTAALVGSGSFSGSIVSTRVQLSSGAAWLPATVGGVVSGSSSTQAEFAGMASGTYYVTVDAVGNAIASTTSNDALYQVSWNGTSLSSLTFIGEVFGYRKVATKTGSYTITAGDIGSVILMNNTGAATVTVPGTFPLNGEVDVIRINTGAVTYAAGAGATLNSKYGLLTGQVQYDRARILNTASAPTSGTATYVMQDLAAGIFTLTGTGTGQTMVLSGNNGTGTGVLYTLSGSGNANVAAPATGVIVINVPHAISTGTGTALVIPGTGSGTGTGSADKVKTLVQGAGTGVSISDDGSGNVTLNLNFYDMADWWPGLQTTSGQRMFMYVAPRALSLPSGIASSKFKIGTNPAATTTLTINKNGSSVGSLSISTGGVFTPTFTGAVSLAAGDVLSIEGQATGDASGANYGFTFVASLA